VGSSKTQNPPGATNMTVFFTLVTFVFFAALVASVATSVASA
jgi:hypothetical protein